jgi:hypothetical protein
MRLRHYHLALILCLLLIAPFRQVYAQADAWKTIGNSNSAGTAYIGTSDSTSLPIKTNGSTRFFIAANGKIGIGTTNPSAKLDLGSGDIRVRSYAGTGLRLLAVDSNGLFVPSTIGLKGGGGGNCSPVLDGWGIVNPSVNTLQLCGPYTGVQVGSQAVVNNGNLPNLMLDVRGDFRTTGNAVFNALIGGTGLNVVFADQYGKLTLANSVGMDPFWSSFGTNVQSGMFLGSRNNEDLLVKTNNLTRMTVSKTGALTVGSLAGSGDADVMVDANGKLSRATGGKYWETGGNQVSTGQILGSLNNEPLKFVTRGATRMEIAAVGGEVAINSPTIPGIMLNIDAPVNNGIALRARATATSTNYSPYAMLSVVNSNDAKAFAIWNEAQVVNGCPNGTEVFRIWGDGRVEAKRVKVTMNGWCDYVFDADYKLAPLDQVNAYIQAHGHLPEVPSTAEVQAHGVDVGDMDALLLKKIEELTLYAIAQQKRCDLLEKQVLDLNAQLEGK